MAFCVIAITSLYLIDLNSDDYIFSDLSSSEALVVYLCGVTAGAQCPDCQHRKKRAVLLHNTQTRITGQGQQNNKETQGQADCATDPNYMGVQFTDYYFNFYRRCD
ncbi:UNVERIFIED_CONTAM: hypothetical protein FKN15_040023 [Acipenser sinensis]